MLRQNGTPRPILRDAAPRLDVFFISALERQYVDLNAEIASE